MSYDVVGQQILQTGIPESKANLIGTTEVSVASLAESVMLGVAIIANDVSHFGFLATLSLLSVVGAAWLFCKWLVNPTDTQRSLLSFDLQPNVSTRHRYNVFAAFCFFFYICHASLYSSCKSPYELCSI